VKRELELIDWIEGELARIEQLDEMERESKLLAPGEEAIKDARLS